MTPYDDVALPRGTLLTVRGSPLHEGRRLLLTDGTAEVPFVDDGSGHVVARWPLADSVKLTVVARPPPPTGGPWSVGWSRGPMS